MSINGRDGLRGFQAIWTIIRACKSWFSQIAEQREESTMSKAEESGLVEKSGDAEEHVTQLENEASRLRAAASRVVQNGKTVAQRWGRQGLTAAEGLAGNATNHIKHDPVRSVAISFVIGLGVGAVVGWGSARINQNDR
jgi:ElaB/YqjD/DUF883 family membrane-anchored ribosome-binding protein